MDERVIDYRLFVAVFNHRFVEVLSSNVLSWGSGFLTQPGIFWRYRNKLVSSEMIYLVIMDSIFASASNVHDISAERFSALNICRTVFVSMETTN